MKIILAGFNVDTETLREYRKKDVCLTPESISAAYARISRSPKAVNKLREEARKEVAKARRSNRAIIFEMGHHSIAEHAVFNFDIIGISRRAVEELERFRLCSYTEKSQRYVTLKGDFVIPKELRTSSYIGEYKRTIELQNSLYKKLCRRILDYQIKNLPKAYKSKRQTKLLENLAKEDARYILAMATQAQVGATVNARNLELMIRRFASHPLKEVNELGEKLFSLVKAIAPSIILFSKANDYDEKTYPALTKYANKILSKSRSSLSKQNVHLLDHTPSADERILTALLFKASGKDYRDCRKIVRTMSKKAKRAFFKQSCQHMELYDATLREFEFANLTYSLQVSAACFGQLKRHRIATLTCQEYNPVLGCTIPESVKEVGYEKQFVEILKKTEKMYQKIEKKYPRIGSYVLTNAHRKRVLLRVNLRELYHISRLREDPTAQWDIRNMAHEMSRLAKRVMPITTQLLGGKTDYPNFYFTLYKKRPKITEVPEL